MKMQRYDYLLILLWMVSLVGIGFCIGLLTKPEVNSWYSALYRSLLTPPNYVFSVVWTFLYVVLGFVGWFIWSSAPSPEIFLTKRLYLVQLCLNWSWSPLFFLLHAVDMALIVLVVMDLIVATLSWLIYLKNKVVGSLMALYLVWILFATYLNAYIWLYN